MRVFILSLFLTALSFAQVDSMRVTWVDPTANDLDSIRIYADTTAFPTTWRGSVAEATEYFDWQPPYAGLWRVRTRAMDDSTNLSSYSSIDTVTIWGSSYTTYTAGADYTWLWTDANNPVDTVLDYTAGLQVSMPVADNQFTYTDSGLVADGNDYLRNTATPSGLFAGGITIEVVVKITNATAEQILWGLRDATPDAFGIGINTNTLVGTMFNGTDDLTYNGAITAGWHHIIATWDSTTAFHIYVDGSEVSDAGDSYQYGGLLASARIAISSDGGGTAPASSGTIYTYWAIYANTILNSTQAANNYGSEIIQTSIPVWAR